MDWGLFRDFRASGVKKKRPYLYSFFSSVSEPVGV